MNSMGFQTPANIPYRVIGSPLYLDQKQIILYGLGQFTVKIFFKFRLIYSFYSFNNKNRKIQMLQVRSY